MTLISSSHLRKSMRLFPPSGLRIPGRPGVFLRTRTAGTMCRSTGTLSRPLRFFLRTSDIPTQWTVSELALSNSYIHLLKLENTVLSLLIRLITIKNRHSSCLPGISPYPGGRTRKSEPRSRGRILRRHGCSCRAAEGFCSMWPN